MDQVKTVLAALKKHHFWVLCVVVVAVGLASWLLATRSVDQACAARVSKIQDDAQQMGAITSIAPHPNQPVVDAINARTAQLKMEVLEAWEELYTVQKKKNPLPKVLSEGFQKEFEGLGPTDEINWKYRQEYMEFIGSHIPTLFEMVDILRREPLEEGANGAIPGSPQLPTGPGGRFMGGEGGMEYDGSVGGGMGYAAGPGGEGGQFGTKLIGVVNWDPTDRARLERRFSWPSRPTTQQVRLAQEDLWVYEALLRIIKNTNGPVKNYFDAPIKQIRELQIGREAAAAWRRADGGSMPAGGGERYGTEHDGPAPTSGGAGSPAVMGYDDGGMGQTANSRYVDENCLPVEVDELGRPVFKDEQGNILGSGPYRLMPIRLVLVMNQAKLAKLLVECANSNMPVEPRGVYLGMNNNPMANMGRPSQPGMEGGDLGHGGGGRMSYSSDYDGGGQYDGGYQSYGTGGASGQIGGAQSRTLDVQVEIQGTICIYNPPDEEKLGTAVAAVQAAQPAGVTPPATAPTEPPVAAPPAGTAPPVEEAAGGPPPVTGQ